MESPRNGKLYRELFFSTLKLSASTFGGGFVIVPLMRRRFVDELHWIDEKEMLDLIAVSQSSPGPIAVNASLMIGYRMGGVPGALVTACGTVLPPLVILTVLSFFYQWFRDNLYVAAVLKGMRAGVAAVICSVVLDMGGKLFRERDAISVVLLFAVFIAVYFCKVNIALVIACCAIVGLITGFARKKRAAHIEPSSKGTAAGKEAGDGERK